VIGTKGGEIVEESGAGSNMLGFNARAGDNNRRGFLLFPINRLSEPVWRGSHNKSRDVCS
jgi:hypothetical protein